MLLSTAVLATAATLFSTTFAAPTISRRDDYLCGYGTEGIKLPTANTTIYQTADDDLSCTSVEIVYCSGQYFKTSSLDATVWLSPPGQQSGEILAKNVAPDDSDAPAGYYSYRFNVSICPTSGSYMTGQKTLAVYETATGYYNEYNYFISEIDVNLAVNSTSAKH